jgi:methionyl-tRNA formyltransferase
MKIIFFGSSQFAVPSLTALIDAGYNISLVVTQPDRKKGRGLHLEGTAVKVAAQEKGIEVFQPDDVNSSGSMNYLKKSPAELFAVISYGHILSEDVLRIPSVFCINAHGSLLPKYRGAAPINWAIINDEEATGITVIKMTEKMDAGPMIIQQAVDIEKEDTFISLEDKLSYVAAGLMVKAVKRIEDNKYELIPQDENDATYAPKLKKEDGLIVWEKSAGEIHNLVRGCIRWPGAFSCYNGKMMKILSAAVATSQSRKAATLPGEIIDVSKNGILVAAGKDDLIIKELQIEGSRRMNAQEFISGHKIGIGEKLGK